MLLIDGVKYKLYTPRDEDELENVVKEHAREIFGEDCVYFDLKHKLTSKSGIGSIPDGYVFKLAEPHDWFIIETELSTHPVYDHIVTQLSKFISGIENYNSQNEIISAIYDETKEDKVLRAQIERMIGSGEIYRFIHDLITHPPRIAVIIDKIDGVEEACKVLKQDIKIIQLETYQREDAPTVRAYVFKPLHEFKPTPVKAKPQKERHKIRLLFWEELLEKSEKRGMTLFQNRKPSKDNWIGVGAGRSGLSYVYVILMHSSRVELYISTGDGAKNKKIFDKLYSQKERIEQDFGAKMGWDRLDNKKDSRIAVVVTEVGLRDEEKWDQIQNNMIDTMIKFENSLKERVRNLPS